MVTRALLAVLAVLGLALAGGPAAAQPRTKITVAIYAPTVEFGAATARLAYVQALAKAIEQHSGVQVEARSYANLAALEKDKVDFAIIDGPCYATHLGWRLLAAATTGGASTRRWALHAGPGATMQGLRGKKLAFIASGCNDAAFIDHAMLESEVDARFFGARIGKPDLTAAVAEVAAVKTAHAVFAPVGSARGLTKLFETGAVPNPAFVVINARLPAATIDKVARAVLGYGGGGAITGWAKASRDLYSAFAARLARTTKAPLFAAPAPVRLELEHVLIEPPTLRDPALVDVRHHFVRPRGERLE